MGICSMCSLMLSSHEPHEVGDNCLHFADEKAEARGIRNLSALHRWKVGTRPSGSRSLCFGKSRIDLKTLPNSKNFWLSLLFLLFSPSLPGLLLLWPWPLSASVFFSLSCRLPPLPGSLTVLLLECSVPASALLRLSHHLSPLPPRLVVCTLPNHD